MKPIVSLILTSYNKPYYLEESIKSVLNQTENNWELFIMDDNSNEETVKVIEKFVQDERIHYHNSFIEEVDRYKTTRYATIINQALKLVKGKYISYLTDDTVYVPDRLREMVLYLENNHLAQIVYSSQLIKKVNGKGEIIHEFVRSAKEIIQDACFRVDHCSVMHSKELLEIIYRKYNSYWDDNKDYWNHGDCIFWKRLNEIAPFYPIDKVLDITYKTPTSIQNILNNIPNTILDGTLVKGTTKDVYLITNQSRKKINKQLFIFYKYREEDILFVPDIILCHFPESAPVDGRLNIPNYLVIKEEETGKFYYLENGIKREIKSQFLFKKLRFYKHPLIILKKELLANYPDGPSFINLNYSNFIPPARKVIKTNNRYWIFLQGKLSSIDIKVVKYFRLLDQSIILPRPLIENLPKGNDIFFLTQKPL